ncbi:CPBP family intramembrane metalloprotease [Corynebacterium riegelii]|uniref:CPBP family intramembrane glutamic endopeptidase n=1 Tax=Corynebacterium riegelii TaxID=156976 RepID=UPI00254C6A75|nr:CPBP family intramembrane glutamic endopeptidase [Corynebacterium riegelii]MDK7181174.1 CPBP family intramembrane metalloprotease [Corynebacterium riegelii]
MPDLRTQNAPALRDVLVALAAMASMYALLIGQGLLLARLGVSRSTATALIPVILVIAMAVPMFVLFRYMRGAGLGLGFTKLGRRGWHLLWQTPAVVVAAATLSAIVGTLIGLAPDKESATGVLASEAKQAAPVLLLLIAYLLVGPLIEEVVFRCVLMGYFDTRMSAVASVLLTSAIFSAVHIAPVVILYTFFLGIGLALVARFHGNITASYIVHAANNLLASAATFAAFIALL